MLAKKHFVYNINILCLFKKALIRFCFTLFDINRFKETLLAYIFIITSKFHGVYSERICLGFLNEFSSKTIAVILI